MNEHGMNLFIVDSDTTAAKALEQKLYNRFGKNLIISTFSTGESCLAKVDKNTGFVVLAYFFAGQNGDEILKSIKAINPTTEVIMLSTNTDIGIGIAASSTGRLYYTQNFGRYASAPPVPPGLWSSPDRRRGRRCLSP